MITTTITATAHGGLKHYHDEDMQSLSLRTDKPLDPTKFMPWLQDLVATEGQKILRSKGILPFTDDDDRYVFQGVHMMLEGDHQRAWKDGEKRESRLVFIGRESAGAVDPRRLRELHPLVMTRFRSGDKARLDRLGHRSRAPGRDRRARHGGAFSWRTRRLRRRGGGASTLVAADGETAPVDLHGGGILCAASDGKRIVTGGDDGKVVALDAKGEIDTLATDAKRRWIDNVALHPDGAFAWSAGKTAFVRSAQGRGQIVRCAVDGRRAGVRAEGPAARDRALQRRDAVVSEHGRRRRSGSNGQARISAWCSAPTTNSSSPRCTNRRCMAGGSPITATCG